MMNLLVYYLFIFSIFYLKNKIDTLIRFQYLQQFKQFKMEQMKQLQNSQPLAYRLNNIELITSLPYIDEELPELKNNVQYLIKSEQQEFTFNQQQYLKDLPLPLTPLIDSEQFTQRALKIQQKIQAQTQKKQGKDKKQQKKIQVPEQNDPELKEKIRKILCSYEQNQIKEINLEIYQKFGGTVMKEAIEALENKRILLERRVAQQKRKIEELNITRKYQQMQARERQQTVFDRTQVTMYKRRKIQ